MLSEKIRAKVAEAMKFPFVGNYAGFSEDEINELYREAADIFIRYSYRDGRYVSLQEDRIIFVALANLTKEWQLGETGWLEFLSKRLFVDDQIKGKKYQILTNCVEKLARNNDIFMLTSMHDKYYATICCHALSPLSSMESLFDLCWEVYTLDFEFDDSCAKVFLDDIAHSLRTKLETSLDDRDFTLGSKVYSLRIAQKGLAVDNQVALCILLDEIFQDISCCFNRKSLPECDYLSTLIRCWWERKSATYGMINERKFISTPARDFTSFRPRFIAKEGLPFLLVPRIRLSDSLVDPIFIKVKNGNETKIHQFVRIRGSGLLLTTEELCFPLKDISLKAQSSISVAIYCGEKKLYDSEKSLYRSFILFDKSGKEVKGDSLIPGNFFLCIDDPHKGQIPQDLQRIRGNFFSMVTRENDVLQVGMECIYFSQVQNDTKGYFSYNRVSDVSYESEGITYTIFNGDLTLIIENEINEKNIGIKCGETLYNIFNLPQKHQNGKIQIDLNSIVECGKPVSIRVFLFSTNKLLLPPLNCLRFQDFKIDFDHDLYYSSPDKNTDLRIGQVEVSFNGHLQVDDLFDISQDDFSLPYMDGRFLYVPPIMRWRIDDGNCSSEPQTIYFQQLTNGSCLHISFLLDSDDTIETNAGKLTRNNQGDFNLGAFVFSQKDNKLHEVIVFLKRKGKFYEILRVFMTPGFLSDPLSVNTKEKSLIINLSSFVGPVKPNISIVLLSTNEKEIRRIPLFEENNSIDLNEIDDGNYLISIVFSKFEAFRKVDSILLKKMIFLGDEKKYRFKNKYIVIKGFKPLKKVQSMQIEFTCAINNLSFLNTIEGHDIYKGDLNIFFPEERKWKKIVSLKDCQNNSIMVNPVRIEIIDDHTCYLGYGLDLEDLSLGKYDEFCIASNKKTFLVGTGWSSSFNVDYYFFDTEEIYV